MSEPAEPSTERTPRRPVWRRFLPIGILAGAIALAFAFGLDEYLSYQALCENSDALAAWVDKYSVVAPLVYILVYTVVVALSLPGATFMTLAGGFMFGAAGATAYTVVGATLGATIIFLAAKTALGDVLYQKAGPGIRRMEDGFRENALSYLLVLRLIPLFPFWLVNLVPAFLGVRLSTYVIGTFIGIIPGTFVFCLAGAGLGDVLRTCAAFSVGSILTPTMIAALIGLAVLALLPIAYKKFRKGSAS